MGTFTAKEKFGNCFVCSPDNPVGLQLKFIKSYIENFSPTHFSLLTSKGFFMKKSRPLSKYVLYLIVFELPSSDGEDIQVRMAQCNQHQESRCS